ncbi:MAG TPA: type II secretion system F family protein [Rhizomicrobium sp.]|nr:type II secretion system F family protein [Rhizomicrobium sp.]
MSTIAPLAFVLLAAASGALVAAYLLREHVAGDIQKRVDSAMKNAGSPARHPKISPLHTRMNVFTRFFTLGMPRTWGVNANPVTLTLVGAAAAIVAWFVVHGVLKFPSVIWSPLMVLSFWLGPNMLVRMSQAKSDQRFLDLFPDSIDMIVRMLRAGLPVSAAIRNVAREAAPPMDAVFTSLADQIDIGISFDEALAISSERIGLPDFRFFAAAVTLQRTTGGNLAATLEILGDIIRRRRVVRLKARAATAEVRISAYVLGALPFIVIAGLLIVSPSYLTPLITDRRGNVILAVAAAMLVMAFLVMRHMTRSAVRM